MRQRHSSLESATLDHFHFGTSPTPEWNVARAIRAQGFICQQTHPVEFRYLEDVERFAKINEGLVLFGDYIEKVDAGGVSGEHVYLLTCLDRNTQAAQTRFIARLEEYFDTNGRRVLYFFNLLNTLFSDRGDGFALKVGARFLRSEVLSKIESSSDYSDQLVHLNPNARDSERRLDGMFRLLVDRRYLQPVNQDGERHYEVTGNIIILKAVLNSVNANKRSDVNDEDDGLNPFDHIEQHQGDMFSVNTTDSED